MRNQKPFRGIQLNRTHPLSKGLVACYLFNEMTGETVFDLSGNGNNGTLENGVAWGNGRLKFDGVDDYVLDSGFNINFSSFSFGAWVKFDDDYRQPVIVGGDGSGSGDRPIDIFLGTGSARTIFVDTRIDSADYSQSNSGVIPTLGQWYHIVGVYDGEMSIYINGVLKAGQTGGNGTNGADGTDGLKIGEGTNLYGWGNTFFNGSIDSVRIYNRALPAEEVTWLYREPYAMFEPSFNPALLYPAAPPVGAIMNQFQRANIGADLYNGVFA
jgi:hypothetical protein